MQLRHVPAALCAAVATLAAAPAALAETPGAGERPYEAGASNMGICSPFLASLGVRDDINHLIQENPGLFDGAEHPGGLYSVRAKQKVNLPPPFECLKRR